MVRKKKEESDIMEIYTTEITYICPKRGKVTEKVKVKKYKPVEREHLIEVSLDDLESILEQDIDE